MKDLLMDPVVAAAGGVIVVGLILLVLALRALFRSSNAASVKEFNFPFPTREPLSVLPSDSNPFSANTIVAPPAPPTANADVLNKVDLIAQRLVDMQLLLNKQVSVSTPAGATHAGLSPEMLDKLLKITASVAQQIDGLQKALGAGVTSPPVPTPSVLPHPSAPHMMSVSQVIGSSGKSSQPPANP